VICAVCVYVWTYLYPPSLSPFILSLFPPSLSLITSLSLYPFPYPTYRVASKASTGYVKWEGCPVVRTPPKRSLTHSCGRVEVVGWYWGMGE
jgi:hypothetical protein